LELALLDLQALQNFRFFLANVLEGRALGLLALNKARDPHDHRVLPLFLVLDFFALPLVALEEQVVLDRDRLHGRVAAEHLAHRSRTDHRGKERSPAFQVDRADPLPDLFSRHVQLLHRGGVADFQPFLFRPAGLQIRLGLLDVCLNGADAPLYFVNVTSHDLGLRTRFTKLLPDLVFLRPDVSKVVLKLPNLPNFPGRLFLGMAMPDLRFGGRRHGRREDENTETKRQKCANHRFLCGTTIATSEQIKPYTAPISVRASKMPRNGNIGKSAILPVATSGTPHR